MQILSFYFSHNRSWNKNMCNPNNQNLYYLWNNFELNFFEFVFIWYKNFWVYVSRVFFYVSSKLYLRFQFVHSIDHFLLLEVSLSSDFLFLLWVFRPKQRNAEPKHNQITPDEKSVSKKLIIATM